MRTVEILDTISKIDCHKLSKGFKKMLKKGIIPCCGIN